MFPKWISLCAGLVTATVFVVASWGKLSIASEWSLGTFAAFAEAPLALLAIFLHRVTIVQRLLSAVFFCFACYIIFVLPPDAMDCKCFGAIRYFQPWQVLALDLLLMMVWGLLGFRSKFEGATSNRVASLQLGGITVLACLISISVFAYKRAELLDVDLKTVRSAFSEGDAQLLGSVDAVYLYRSRCSICVAKLRDFENWCDSEHKSGAVIVGSDSAFEPETSLPVVVLIGSEANFSRYPAAMSVESGVLKTEISL